MILSSFLMTILLLPQLIFSLSTAQEWKCEHNGFHYPIFYNFIIDFFKDVDLEDVATQENIDDLLDWWNWYVVLGLYRRQLS